MYANVLNKPVLVPDSPPASIDSGIFAQVPSGIFVSVEEAQANETFTPEPGAVRLYEDL